MNLNKYIIILIIFLFGCESDYSPKPKAFMKIDLPEKKYLNYKSSCGYSFEYPYYAKINKLNKCMLDVEFSDLSAKLHISYFQLNSPNDLGIHIEESNILAYKHIVKANSIQESDLINYDSKLYGTLYDYDGFTATSIQFFLTDSLNHFFRGALYFNTEVNDSILPVNTFIKKDIIHLIESFYWKDK
tara:strand:+ start:977 stop:1537 length:561 start_codon:yes stop_codon:yes gene_type:complete